MTRNRPHPQFTFRPTRRLVASCVVVSVAAAGLALANPPAALAAATTVYVPASSDAYVDSGNPNGNAGSSVNLFAGSVPGHVYRSYLKFAIPTAAQGNITAASLVLTRTAHHLSSVINLNATSDSWSESTITDSNAPAKGSYQGGQATDATTTTVTFPLTASQFGSRSTASYVVSTSSTTDTSQFISTEGGSGKPLLVLTYGTDSGGGSSNPSGVAMPVGDLPGFTQTMADDFNGSSLPSDWYSYSGMPGGDPGGWWDPSHVVVSGGKLALVTSKDAAHCTGSCQSYNNYVSGGVGARTGQTYGRISARLRYADAHGVPAAFLLMPTDGTWPPEIDWVEGAGDVSGEQSSLHYGANNTEDVKTVNTDLTDWHTWTVTWTPGKIVYSLDGTVFGTTTGSNVPAKGMALAMQAQTFNCTSSPIWTCPDSSTPASSEVDVDWITSYAYTP